MLTKWRSLERPQPDWRRFLPDTKFRLNGSFEFYVYWCLLLLLLPLSHSLMADVVHCMNGFLFNTYFDAAAVAIIGWVGLTMTPLFAALKYSGLLRVSEDQENQGLDQALHGGPCYPEASEVSTGVVAAAASPSPNRGSNKIMPELVEC